MYVCICQAITDKDIRAAAENGVASFAELKRHMEIANVCGKCRMQVKQIFTDAQTEIEERYTRVA